MVPPIHRQLSANNKQNIVTNRAGKTLRLIQRPLVVQREKIVGYTHRNTTFFNTLLVSRRRLAFLTVESKCSVGLKGSSYPTLQKLIKGKLLKLALRPTLHLRLC